MEPTVHVLDAHASAAAPPRRWRLALFALSTVAIVAIYAVRVRTGMADFRVNYRAAQRLLAGQTLYERADAHWMFKYLPASAIPGRLAGLGFAAIESGQQQSVAAMTWTLPAGKAP